MEVFVSDQRSVRQYRAIDLSLFALMVVLSEALLVTAETRWFPYQAYTVSATAALTAIVIVRWGPWAAIHAALGGLIFCLMSGGAPWQYAVYGLGNGLSLLAALYVRKKGDAFIRATSLRSMGFGLAVVLLMQTGRALMALAFGASPQAVTGFYTTDSVTMLFTVVLMWIVRRLDGLFENQYHYLGRIRAEREREEGGVR